MVKVGPTQFLTAAHCKVPLNSLLEIESRDKSTSQAFLPSKLSDFEHGNYQKENDDYLDPNPQQANSLPTAATLSGLEDGGILVVDRGTKVDDILASWIFLAKNFKDTAKPGSPKSIRVDDKMTAVGYGTNDDENKVAESCEQFTEVNPETGLKKRSKVCSSDSSTIYSSKIKIGRYRRYKRATERTSNPPAFWNLFFVV